MACGFFLELAYLSATKTTTNIAQEKKEKFTALTGLPDLAISTEATFVRHISISDFFSFFKDDPMIREYFPSTFAYNPTINSQKSYNEN